MVARRRRRTSMRFTSQRTPHQARWAHTLTRHQQCACGTNSEPGVLQYMKKDIDWGLNYPFVSEAVCTNMRMCLYLCVYLRLICVCVHIIHTCTHKYVSMKVIYILVGPFLLVKKIWAVLHETRFEEISTLWCHAIVSERRHNTYVYTYIYTPIFVCMYLCMVVCMHVCMYEFWEAQT